MARGGKHNSANNRAPASNLTARTLVLDNGAHTIKAGFSPEPGTEPNASTDCHIIPNCITRSQRDRITYVGSELYDCADFGELALRRPVEKGFVVNWEGEKAIWEKSFGLTDGGGAKAAVVACDPTETNLILTEAPNALAALQKNADEMIFEEFEFASALRVSGWLSRFRCRGAVRIGVFGKDC